MLRDSHIEILWHLKDEEKWALNERPLYFQIESVWSLKNNSIILLFLGTQTQKKLTLSTPYSEQNYWHPQVLLKDSIHKAGRLS